jgi:hypothetical protein
MSETIPQDEDRGPGDAFGDPDADEVGGLGDAPGTALDEEGGTGPDDGGPGSQNM